MSSFETAEKKKKNMLHSNESILAYRKRKTARGYTICIQNGLIDGILCSSFRLN